MSTFSNINPIYFLEPVSSIAIVLVLLLLYRKKGLTAAVFFLAALSYFLAIAAKSILQYFTLPWMETQFGYTSIPTAIYFGAQTAIFEVVGAYLVARHWKDRVRQNNAEAYGISLAFMENAIMIGGLGLLNLLVNYFILAAGPSSLSDYVRNELLSSSAALFYGTSSALPIIGFSVLERISSLILHYSWGFLVVTSVSTRQSKYLVLAIPFGFVDSLVPYASVMGVPVFEVTIFIIALISLTIALAARKLVRESPATPS